MKYELSQRGKKNLKLLDFETLIVNQEEKKSEEA